MNMDGRRPRPRVDRSPAWRKYVQAELHARKLLTAVLAESNYAESDCPTIRAIAGDVMHQLTAMAGILQDIRQVLAANNEGAGTLGTSLQEVLNHEEMKAVSGGKCDALPGEDAGWTNKTCLEALAICEEWLDNCANVL